jgi:phenylacetaldehyde dehydrogenase
MSIAATSPVPVSLQSFLSEPKKMLIDGNWVAARTGKNFDVFDPATGQVIAEVAQGESADVDSAVAAARRAFDSEPWPKMTASMRGRRHVLIHGGLGY